MRWSSVRHTVVASLGCWRPGNLLVHFATGTADDLSTAMGGRHRLAKRRVSRLITRVGFIARSRMRGRSAVGSGDDRAAVRSA